MKRILCLLLLLPLLVACGKKPGFKIHMYEVDNPLNGDDVKLLNQTFDWITSMSAGYNYCVTDSINECTTLTIVPISHLTYPADLLADEYDEVVAYLHRKAREYYFINESKRAQELKELTYEDLDSLPPNLSYCPLKTIGDPLYEINNVCNDGEEVSYHIIFTDEELELTIYGANGEGDEYHKFKFDERMRKWMHE